MAATLGHNPSKNSWLDISIDQFYRIQKHITLEDPTDNVIALYNTIYGVDIASESILSMLKAISNLSFLNEEMPEVKLKKNSILKIDGKEYVIQYNILDLPASEFLDLDHYLRQPDNIHLILSYILKPIESRSKSFFGKEIYVFAEVTKKEIQEHLLYNLDIATANAILTFFLKVWNRLINSYKVELMMQQNRILRMMICSKARKKEEKLKILGLGLNGLMKSQAQLEEVGKMFIK